MASRNSGTRFRGRLPVRAVRLGVAAVETGGLVLAAPVAAARAAAPALHAAVRAVAPSLGSQLWVSRYDGPGHGGDEGRAIVVSPDGSTV